jgi:hypothetical protein
MNPWEHIKGLKGTILSANMAEQVVPQRDWANMCTCECALSHHDLVAFLEVGQISILVLGICIHA